MRLDNLPNVKTLTSYARFVGGLDLVSPPLSIDAGKCISAMNYEANSLGGYRRIDGYERFDGRISPSDRTYWHCRCNLTGSVSVGDIIVGETTGAKGKVLQVGTSELIISRVLDGESITFTDSGDLVNLANHGATNGTIIQFTSRADTTGVLVNTNYYVVNATTNNFQVSATLGGSAIALTNDGTGVMTRNFVVENFKVGGVSKGSFLSVPLANGATTGFGHATAQHLTANDYRADISAVPGSGVIRGICMYKGVAYAFRNNAAGTEVDIYKSTGGGWQKITLFKSLPFKNGNMDILDGVVINQKQGGDVSAGAFVVGTQYIISAVGTTDFTLIGATDNNIGTRFVATGVGTGTGTAYKVASAIVKRQVIEAEFNQLDLESTSITSLILGTGAKSLIVEKDKAYQAGQDVIVTSAVKPENYAIGTISSYNSATGELIISVTSIVGSGTFASWAVHAESTNVLNYSGRLILADVIGTFNNTDPIRVGIVDVAMPDGVTTDPVTQISILPGGNYQFVQHNFKANVDAKKLYGVDSLNRAFEFDGDVYIPIRTQITIDAPEQIAVVNTLAGDSQLVLSYFGQLLFSAVGNPHDFRTTSLGFQDLGIGDTVTGLSLQVGGILAVFCRDSCYQAAIEGQTGLWAAKLISPELGAIHYGVLNLGGLYSFDDKGIVKIVPSYVFGGFEHDTVSRAIQPVIDRFREKIVATAAFKAKNQCRFFARDGSGICMTMVQGQNGIEHHFTQFQYPIAVSYAWYGEDASGRDIVLIGDEQGYIYVIGKGSSFDGQEITAYLRTAFNNLKSPSAIKRFRKMEVEISTTGYSEIRLNPDFSYADPDVATHIFKNETINGVGGYWDEAVFNTFYYDGKIVSQPEMHIFGSGTNIGLVVFSKSAIDLGHTLSGVILHYTPRKLNR